MAVECYSVVETLKPLTEEQKAYNKFIRTQGQRDDEEKEQQPLEHHLCHVRLVQPPQKGKSVPSPKWEIVHDLFTMPKRDESEWALAYSKMGTDVKVFDPYKDAHRLDTNCEPFRHQPSKPLRKGEVVVVPDYDKQWEKSSVLGSLKVVVCYRPDLAFLPMGHPLDPDLRVQLRQIHYLFPETYWGKMPLNIALDFVRDRL